MPEPLPTASSFAEIAPGIFRWAAFSPFHKVELTSHAVASADGLLVFDPIPLAESEASRLRSAAACRGIVLTNGNHQRASADWAELLDVAVLGATPELFPGEHQIRPWRDQDSWQARALPGGAPGETMFHHAGLSLAVFGDAVVNLPDRQLELLPDRYCTDPGALRSSLRNLPSFERALFAHGQPLLSGASAKLAALL